jgi:hypothetical protein
VPLLLLLVEVLVELLVEVEVLAVPPVPLLEPP